MISTGIHDSAHSLLRVIKSLVYMIMGPSALDTVLNCNGIGGIITFLCRRGTFCEHSLELSDLLSVACARRPCGSSVGNPKVAVNSTLPCNVAATTVAQYAMRVTIAFA